MERGGEESNCHHRITLEGRLGIYRTPDELQTLRYLHLYDGGASLKAAEDLWCRLYALPLCYLDLIDLYPHSFWTEDLLSECATNVL